MRAVSVQGPAGLPKDRARRICFKTCGGPLDDVAPLIDVLMEALLMSEDGTHYRLTKLGRHVRTQDHQNGGRLLATALIESGQFAEQARVALEELEMVDDELFCTSSALARTPQLTSLLLRWPDVRRKGGLRIPPDVADMLGTVWALLPERVERDEGGRKAVGDRGELYTYQLERERTTRLASVRWVARDDESLGYDVENLETSPSRKIEVKASAGEVIRFFLTSNEWRQAHRFGEFYEIQFWGEIRLGTPTQREYERLRGLGYPKCFRDVARLLKNGSLDAQTSIYEVRAR
jgi:hypothetical protein